MLCKSESAAQFDVVVGDVTMYFCLCGKKWGMVCVKENSVVESCLDILDMLTQKKLLRPELIQVQFS